MEFLSSFATAAFLFVLVLLPRVVEAYLAKHGMTPAQYDWN